MNELLSYTLCVAFFNSFSDLLRLSLRPAPPVVGSLTSNTLLCLFGFGFPSVKRGWVVTVLPRERVQSEIAAACEALSAAPGTWWAPPE